MYVRMNCKLQSPGHIFEIRLCFRCFYQLERSLRWMLDWRQLLRPQHHFLPGEENHYKGHLTDKAGYLDWFPSCRIYLIKCTLCCHVNHVL